VDVGATGDDAVEILDLAARSAVEILNGTFILSENLLASRAGIMCSMPPMYFLHPDEPAARELVAFTRRLRSEATPQVLAQHLTLTKHWETNEIGWPAEIALKSFVSALVGFDDFIAADEARKRAVETRVPLPPPVPIEDTTLELTDGPLDRW
jgi:hypothetical protein